MRIWIVFISFLFFADGWTQPRITLDTKLTDADKFGDKLPIGWGKLIQDGKATDSILTQNGRIFFTLDTGHVYKAVFYRNGYVTKFLSVDTRNLPKNYKSKSTIKIEVALFRQKEGLDVEFLKTQAMGIAEYSDITKKIDWNRDYSRMITEKIIQATLEYARKKKEGEKTD